MISKMATGYLYVFMIWTQMVKIRAFIQLVRFEIVYVIVHVGMKIALYNHMRRCITTFIDSSGYIADFRQSE